MNKHADGRLEKTLARPREGGYADMSGRENERRWPGPTMLASVSEFGHSRLNTALSPLGRGLSQGAREDTLQTAH